MLISTDPADVLSCHLLHLNDTNVKKDISKTIIYLTEQLTILIFFFRAKQKNAGMFIHTI